MDFGIYVHTQGPGGLLKESAKKLDFAMRSGLQVAEFGLIDAIFISFQALSGIQSGFRVRKNRVRRDCDLKLITGGKIHYNCMIEFDIDIPDADVIEADSVMGMIFYLKRVLTEVTPQLFKNFPSREAELFILAIEKAQID